MANISDKEKTWKPGPATQTTFNAPGNLAVPYGRYRGVISGRGASGNAPNAATYNTNYNTNYNTAYPIANRPIGTQPIATHNTNYNVDYPVTAYPFAGNSSQTTPGKNYNSGSNFHIDCNDNSLDRNQHSSGNTWSPANSAVSPNPQSIYTSPIPECTWSYYAYQNFLSRYRHLQAATGLVHYQGGPAPFQQASIGCCSWTTFQYSPSPVNASSRFQQTTHSAGVTNYHANYNVEYGVSYPVANRPAATWNTNYNTNYNVAYPIATQPIANQPVATYNASSAGTPATIFGVPFPGGNASNTVGTPNPAPSVAATVFTPYSAPDGTTVAVPVPSGGTVNVRLE